LALLTWSRRNAWGLNIRIWNSDPESNYLRERSLPNWLSLLKLGELKKLPELTRSALELLVILEGITMQADEFYKKLLPSMLQWTLEDMEREIRRIRHIIRESANRTFASNIARLKGGDSLFEIRIKKLLETYHVQFEYHAVLVLGSHRYRPDFLIGTQTILEAAGVPTESYWKHFAEKVKNYVESGYLVYVVVLDKLFEIANSYIPSNARVSMTKYGDFKRCIDEYVKNLRAAKAAHS
jgi:hypothetical protein